jgi:hypothetical protein
MNVSRGERLSDDAHVSKQELHPIAAGAKEMSLNKDKASS